MKIFVVLLAICLLLSACVSGAQEEGLVLEPEPVAAEEAPDKPEAPPPLLEEEAEEEPFPDSPDAPPPPVEATPAQQPIGWDSLLFHSIDPATVVDDGMLEDGGGSHIAQVVPLCQLSFDTLNNSQGVEAFIGAIRSGRRMADMLDSTGWYFATNGTSTVHMRLEGGNYRPGLVAIGAAGQEFLISSAVQAQLSAKGMSPTANTTVKFMGISGFGTGLLFSQGSTEYFAFTESIHDGRYGEPAYLPAHTLMTTLELAEAMELLKDRTVGGVGGLQPD